MITDNKNSAPILSRRSTQQKPITLDQRLFAEAVRLQEDAQGFATDYPQADSLAQQAGGDLEHRVVARAQALPIAPALTEALRQLRSASGLVVGIGLVIAAITGAAAARVALGSQADEPLNFFWVLGSLLGVQTIALLIWLILIFVKPSAMSSGSLGGIALALGRRITHWLHKGPVHIAAIQAGASVFARGAIGRWTLSAISHALWLAFLLGCLALVVLILSTRQHTFVWETTILSEPTYVALTQALEWLPERLGFTTPNVTQITASHWTGEGRPPVESGKAWSALLIGSLTVYGVLPRGLLLLLSLVARRRAQARFRLNTTQPGYLRLQTRLLPVTEPIGVIDAETPHQAAQQAAAQQQPLQVATQGPTAILGLEIEPPASDWPPLQGLEWLDLGFVDNRADRHRALQQVTAAAPMPPRLIVVVCSVTVTPDRGTRAFIHDLQQTARIPVAVVLTDGQRLRTRGDVGQVRQRIEDWRRLAAEAQIAGERVIEVDLDHLTEASRANLATLLGLGSKTAVPARRIEQSFALIVEHARRWSSVPDIGQQAELQRAIARLYQDEHQSWHALLRTTVEESGDQVEQLKTSADRMVALLPERLRKSPRWLAAGAMAGALSCVAAATLVAPAAIASLPLWAGLGAVVSAAIQPSGASSSAVAGSVDLGEAVNSAALFALLLELQGRDEVTITRIVDQVAGDDEPPVIDSPDAAKAWLDAMRHRLDQALAVEHAA